MHLQGPGLMKSKVLIQSDNSFLMFMYYFAKVSVCLVFAVIEFCSQGKHSW